MIVVGGSSSSMLSKALASRLNAELAKMEVKRFPDDEGYVRILSSLDGKDVLLVSNTYPDEKMVETLLLCDAIREFNSKSLTMVIPYFGYARQDKKFNEGEPISARAIATALDNYPERVLVVDIHAESVLDHFRSASALNVSAAGEIAGKLKDLGVDFVLSPDKGRIATAEKVGETIEVPSDYLVKERIDGMTVKMEPKNIDVSGKRVAIVDDIISTGGTIVNASNELKRLGAGTVIAACTHGLFARNALDRLAECCDKVISSDTLENPTSEFTVAPAIARALGN